MVAPGSRKPLASRLDAASRERLNARYEALTHVEEKFRNFDIVWAKVQGFPWWPGVLFLSWDVVRQAGIRTDPKIVASLKVPPPRKFPIIGAASGKEKVAFRVKRHCLIMFLDKFNFSLLELDPSNVASYTAHYHLYEQAVLNSKNSKYAKKKAEFRRALVKATQLLHMGNEYTTDDLELLKKSGEADKKRRKNGDVLLTEEQKHPSSEKARYDQDAARSAVFNSAKEKQATKVVDLGRISPNKTIKSTITTRKENVAEMISVEAEEIEGVDFQLIEPEQNVETKDFQLQDQKPCAVEVERHADIVSRSPSPIDLTSALESGEKALPTKSIKLVKTSSRLQKKKIDIDASIANVMINSATHVSLEEEDSMSNELSKDKNRQISNKNRSIMKDEEIESVVMTPLSSIWTTGFSSDFLAGSEVQMQLKYKQDFVWDDEVFTDEPSIADREKAAAERQQEKEKSAAYIKTGRDRSLGKRQSRSVQQSQIRQNLMTGNLDPHTMVQCATYRPRDYVEDLNSRSRGGAVLSSPFQVVIHPDAVFVADLHAHLATCEVIGFLGGKWDESSKTLYIQAAFPCRSLEIEGDDGSTDVEMDPGSEIELRTIIENAHLEVVGWYHSHPAFAPDPSIRDIENQTSYQQLFQRPYASKDEDSASKPLEPFVGLIVGTYDTRRSSPVSLFRYFHTRGEKVSGGARREIYMPYEFIPARRHFRTVLKDEQRERRQLYPMYCSVLKHFQLELSATKLQPPTDIKALPEQIKTVGSSPFLVNAHRPVRKRKQSSDTAGGHFVKKAKARRPTLSSSAVKSRTFLTSRDLNQHHPAADEGILTAKSEAKIVNKSTNLSIEEIHCDVSCPGTDKIKVEIVSSDCAQDISIHTETARIDPNQADLQESKKFADNLTFQAGTALKNVCNKRIQILKESSNGSGGNEYCQKNANLAQCKTLSQSITSRAGSDVKHAAIKPNAMAGLTPIHRSVLQHLPATSSGVKSRSLSPICNAVYSRKRFRKPLKTTKNRNRSYSPNCDGPPLSRSFNPLNIASWSFYGGSKPQKPKMSSGWNINKVTLDSTCSGLAQSDNVCLEGAQCTFTEGKNGISVNSSASTKGLVDNITACPRTRENDDNIVQEVQRALTILVEQVLGRNVISDATPAVARTHIKTFMPKMPMNRVSSVEPKLALNTQKMATDEGERKRNAGLQAYPLLCGSNREREDIQTSLERMIGHLSMLKCFKVLVLHEAENKVARPKRESKHIDVDFEIGQDNSHLAQKHLTALRTKYGRGVSACTEQVITLVKYYRNFERRTELNEIWKSRITKWKKIEISLSEYVRFLNISAALRQDFIKDLISYLRESWAATKARKI
ncbi:hypothetical protein CCR75_002327 [Bremia lactucae]|uniref:Myb-like, SWIRM and MPN domain-containing protein 1 n=1 Tax=Bremia lactucae TaxID=4779 RepID=A0A976IKX9_BRELC|nr:hypothetical protein CCR75_002327 [Bremia lactucae]